LNKVQEKQKKSELIDPKFKFQVMKKIDSSNIQLCFQCGTCTADCAIARYSSFYKPRKIARMVQLGLKKKILSNDELWLCTTCFACIDNCPQNVEVSNIVRSLRNITVEQLKRMPDVYKIFAKNILQTGYVYTIPESRLRKREIQKLPKIPDSNRKDIKILFNTVGFSKLLKQIETFNKITYKEDKDGKS
jgi:heterodisulfide reductase subunit C